MRLPAPPHPTESGVSVWPDWSLQRPWMDRLKPLWTNSWERFREPLRNLGLQLTVGVPGSLPFPPPSSADTTLTSPPPYLAPLPPAPEIMCVCFFRPCSQAPFQGKGWSRLWPHVERTPSVRLRWAMEGRWGTATTVEHLLCARLVVGPKHACSYSPAPHRAPGS